MSDPNHYIVLRKGDKYVTLSSWLDHKVDGAEVATYTRGTGTWAEGQHAKEGAKKRTDCATHAEARALLLAEGQKLVAKGHVAETHPFLKLDEEAQDLVESLGGSLATPPVGMDRRAPIFQVSRAGDTPIDEAEDRALGRFARAVGLSAKDERGNTVLHAAAKCSSVALAEACLAAGASPDAPGWRDATPRTLATGLSPKNKARAKLLALFENAQGPAAPTSRELCQAAEHGNVAEVRRALAAGVSVSGPDPVSAKPPIFWAARSSSPESDEVLGLLLGAGATIDGDEVLEEAMGQGLEAAVAVPKVERLVRAGARPSEAVVLEWLDRTELAAGTRRALVAALRGAGAFAAKIPLSSAVTMRDVEAVREALAAGADPHATLRFQPLLHLAACDGCFTASDPGTKKPAVHVTMPASAEIVEALLAAGASADATRESTDDDAQDSLAGFDALGKRADDAPKAALKALKSASAPADVARKAELERITKAIQAARKARK